RLGERIARAERERLGLLRRMEEIEPADLDAGELARGPLDERAWTELLVPELGRRLSQPGQGEADAAGGAAPPPRAALPARARRAARRPARAREPGARRLSHGARADPCGARGRESLVGARGAASGTRRAVREARAPARLLRPAAPRRGGRVSESRRPAPVLELPLVSLPSLHPCADCGACCSYVATQIDDPSTFQQYENIHWYL